MIKRNNRSGQTLIEFAFILPILLLLVMGLFELGRFVFYYSVLNTAVREGTRYAVVQSACDYTSNPNLCTGSYVDVTYTSGCTGSTAANNRVCEAIEEKYFNLGGLDTSQITIDHAGTLVDPEVHITIDYIYDPIFPGLGLLGPLQITVQSKMLMTPIAQLKN